MYGNCFVSFLQDSMKDAENLGPSDLVGKHPSPMIVASGIGQWRHGSLLVLESQRIDIMRERNVPSLHSANPLHCRFNSLSNAFPALATPTAQTPAPEFQGRTIKNIAACCMNNVSSTLSQRFARTEVVGESWITPSSCVIKDLGTCMIQIHYIYIIFILYLYYIYIIFILYLYYIYIIFILYLYYIYIIFILYLHCILYVYIYIHFILGFIFSFILYMYIYI